MDLEKYTDKSKQIVQSAAQELALRSGHQRFMPEHVLASLDGRPRAVGRRS